MARVLPADSASHNKGLNMFCFVIREVLVRLLLHKINIPFCNYESLASHLIYIYADYRIDLDIYKLFNACPLS